MAEVESNPTKDIAARQLLNRIITDYLGGDVWNEIKPELGNWEKDPLCGDSKKWAKKPYGEHPTSRELMVYLREKMHAENLLDVFRAKKGLSSWEGEFSDISDLSFRSRFPETVKVETKAMDKYNKKQTCRNESKPGKSGPLSFYDDGYTYNPCELLLAEKTRDRYELKKNNAGPTLYQYRHANEFDHLVSYLVGVPRRNKSKACAKPDGLKTLIREIQRVPLKKTDLKSANPSLRKGGATLHRTYCGFDDIQTFCS